MTVEGQEREEKGGPNRLRAWLRLVLRHARRLILAKIPPAEAQEVRRAVEADGAFTERFALMTALSAGIAILGLLQSSSAVVIGAMLVSPLMGPIAALGFGIAGLDAERAIKAARTLGIGCAVGVLVGMAFTWLSPIRNATPEIIARTAPTLLDLAVALLSGFAGGYATVHRRGETAIGVAIATALMPPLTTVGYGLAVARFDFFLGALLLFLTNLAAIAFAFALVARLRGVTRPIVQLEITPRLVFAGLAALLILVTPLALTLRRVTLEARASWAAREEISAALGVDQSMIAQLSVRWPNLEPCEITAIVVTNNFDDDAQEQVRARLAERLHTEPKLRLQQLVATDTRAQTEAMIDAALGAQTQRRATVEPDLPIETLRQAAATPTLAAWADTSTRTVYLAAAPLPERSLSDFQAEEARLDALRADWRVAIIPPFRDRITVGFADNATTLDARGEGELQAAIWALKRWGASRVRLEGFAGRNSGATRASRELADARTAEIARLLRAAGFETEAERGEQRMARAFYAEGGAERVRAVDVMPLGPEQ